MEQKLIALHEQNDYVVNFTKAEHGVVVEYPGRVIGFYLLPTAWEYSITDDGLVKTSLDTDEKFYIVAPNYSLSGLVAIDVILHFNLIEISTLLRVHYDQKGKRIGSGDKKMTELLPKAKLPKIEKLFLQSLQNLIKGRVAKDEDLDDRIKEGYSVAVNILKKRGIDYV